MVVLRNLTPIMEGTVLNPHPQCHVRRATMDDSSSMWRIRNSEAVRQVSHHKEVIPWPDHQQWFARYMANPENHCYVLELEGRVIGYCRVDDTLVSIAIDPDQHGHGFGKFLLASTVNAESIDHRELTAEVRFDNPISKRLFQDLGFRTVAELDGYWSMVYTSDSLLK